MECYEGATMIKTFRGLMLTDTEETIVLHTNDGATGYRITKFQVMEKSPLDTTARWAVKIYKISQLGVHTTSFDFSDNTLLAAGMWTSNATAQSYPEDMTIIFDQEIFNQDIYITAKAENGSAVNYYLELEQVKLNLNENTVATLKDIRNKAVP